MSVRERLLTVQIHEAVNIYNNQAQLDKADVEMHRRLGGFNFQRRRLSTFFYRDDDIVSTSNINTVSGPGPLAGISSKMISIPSEMHLFYYQLTEECEV